MFKNHIERLKYKISEMEVKRVESESRLQASEERLASQQHIIESNVLLLHTLQAQHTSAEADKIALSLSLESKGVMLQAVQ